MCWRPSAARYAENPSVLPSGCSRKHVDEPLLVEQRGVERRELRFDLGAPISAHRGIDARELRRQRLLAAFERTTSPSSAATCATPVRVDASSAAATTPKTCAIVAAEKICRCLRKIG